MGSPGGRSSHEGKDDGGRQFYLGDYDVPQEYSYERIAAATNDFSQRMLIGHGGFASVYKGVLTSGKIAVKVMKNVGMTEQRQFLAELATLGNVRHRHLVRLRGWCCCEKELLLIIVYDYMPNGSLDKHLFVADGAGGVEWQTRCRILKGIAKGLIYLHEVGTQHPIVHRDLKPTNILLDNSLNARIADFGLARLQQPASASSTSSDTIRMNNGYSNIFPAETRGWGTLGYTAPECIGGRSCPSATSDVFSFGIIILEVVSGRKAYDCFQSNYAHFFLLDCIRSLFNSTSACIDKRLKNRYDVQDAHRLLLTGLHCCNYDPTRRPTMRRVLRIMEGREELEGLDIGLTTHQSYGSFYTASNSSNSNSSQSTPDNEGALCLENPLYTSSGAARLVSAPREFSWQEIENCIEFPLHSSGEFSECYKGRLSDGSQVVVKFLRRDATVRPMWVNEEEESSSKMIASCWWKPLCSSRKQRPQANIDDLFWAQMVGLGSIRHRNLIALRGRSSKRDEKALVFDYMENGGLWMWIHRPPLYLPWNARFNVVKDVATALLHLHEGCETQIVHRNIHSGEILLDSNFRAKLSNMYLSINMAHPIHHNTLPDMTSPGILDPDFLRTRELSPSIDVYNLGILILELLTGKHTSDKLKIWIEKMLCDNNPLQILDPNLVEPHNAKEINLLLGLAMFCTHSQRQYRPTMRQVVDILEFEESLPPCYSWCKIFLG